METNFTLTGLKTRRNIMTDTNKKKTGRGIILTVAIVLIVGLAGVSFASRGNHGFGVGHSGHNGGCGVTQSFSGSGSAN